MSSDNITATYLATKRKREQPEMDAALARAEAMAASQPQVAQAPQPAVTPKPEGKSLPAIAADSVQDTGRALAHAATGLYDSVGGLINDSLNVFTENLFNYKLSAPTTSRLLAKVVDEPHTIGGKLGSGIVQWAVPFAGTLKAANTVRKATTAGQHAVRGMQAGAVADISSYDTDGGNLSKMLVDLGDQYPSLKNPLTEFLATKDENTDAENRLLAALEGAGVGAALEGVFGLIKAAKPLFKSPAKAPAAATPEAPAGDLTGLAVDTKPLPDLSLQEQVDALVGVRGNAEGAAKWQKRLDVAAATKANAPVAPTAGAKAGYDPDLMANSAKVEAVPPSPGVTLEQRNQEAINAAFFTKELPALEEAVVSGKARSAYWDPAESSVILTREAPPAGSLPLDQTVQLSLAKKPHERTAEDLVALRAYRQLQEAAYRGLELPGMPKGTDAPAVAVEARGGAGKAAMTDAERVEAVSPAQARIEARVTKLEKTDAAPAAALKEGDTITYNGGADSGEVTKVLTDGKVTIIDDATGSPKVVTPDVDELDDVAADIAAANAAFLKAAGRGQGGMVSPSLLANMASTLGGAAAGAAAADDDASFADRLTLAGLGALMGYGIKVGLSRVLTTGERKLLESAPPELRSLASPEVRGIAPVPAGARKARPAVKRESVDKLVNAMKEGGVDNLLNSARTADFNFDYIDTEADVEDIVNAVSSVFEKEIDGATYGVQSHEQTKELAEELGSGVESLKELYGDTNNLAGRVLAHRVLLTASAEKVNSLARVLSGTSQRPPDASDADLILAARKQVAVHAAIQMQMKGVQTEIARALGQFRISSSGLDMAMAEKVAMIDQWGGHKANLEFFNKLSMVNDPKRLNAIMRKSALGRHADALFHSWVAGIMSGPTTQVVNATGSVLTSLGAIGERLGGAAFSAARVADDGVSVGEVHAFLFGMKQGFTVATRITAEAIRTSAARAMKGDLRGVGRALDGQGTAYQAFAKDAPILDNATSGTRGDIMGYQNPITADHLGYDPKTLIGRTVDAYGTLVSVVGRGMSFTDELFKSVHYYGELNAQAYRAARAEGLPDGALAERVSQLIDEPTPEMVQQSMKAAREGTFTSPLGQAGGSFQNFVSRTPGMRYVFPFVRTPVNIMKYVGRRSPLGFASEAIRAELNAGGATRDIAMAKMSIGTSIMLGAAWAASEGMLTGGGELDQSAERLGGVEPYSLKVGGKYISLRRLDPLAMHLGMAADLVDISGHIDEEDASEVGSAIMLSMYRNLVSKSYLSGAVQLLDAFEEGRRGNVKAVEVYLANQTASVLPMTGALNTARKADDPLMRDAQSIIERLKSRIPGMSKELPPTLNVFGEEQELKGGWGPDLVSPFASTVESTQPAAKEIARLNLDLRNPPRRIGSPKGGPGVDLDLKQYHRLMQLVGENFKPAVTALVDSPQYQALPEDPTQSRYPEAKEIVISRMYAKAKQAATARLLNEDPELAGKVMEDKQTAFGVLSGQSFMQQ